jgi:hypothetical protein
MYLIVASVTMLLITLLDDNEAKPPIIVAYLRKPHICNSIIKYSTTTSHVKWLNDKKYISRTMSVLVVRVLTISHS